MKGTRRSVLLVAPLFAVAVALTGCPEKPAPTGGTGPGGGAGVSASTPAGGGPAGAGPGARQPVTPAVAALRLPAAHR